MSEMVERCALALFECTADEWAQKSEQFRIVALKDVRRMIEAMCKWQPIETAPRDGTHVELWHKVWKCPITAQWKVGFRSDSPWIEKTKTTTWPNEAFTHWRTASKEPR